MVVALTWVLRDLVRMGLHSLGQPSGRRILGRKVGTLWVVGHRILERRPWGALLGRGARLGHRGQGQYKVGALGCCHV